jgi:hypothetical protein
LITDEEIGFFQFINFFQPKYDPGFDTDSKRITYQDFSGGIKRGRSVRQTSPTSESLMPIRFGILNVTQPYRTVVPNLCYAYSWG